MHIFVLFSVDVFDDDNVFVADNVVVVDDAVFRRDPTSPTMELLSDDGSWTQSIHRHPWRSPIVSIGNLGGYQSPVAPLEINASPIRLL